MSIGKKAIGYIRVSTIEQALEGYSVEFQEDEIRRYCDYKGLQLIAIFSDEGFSGKNTDRDGFQKMMDYIRNDNSNEIEYLITYRLSRLARNSKDLIETIDVLRDNGVDTYFVKDAVDTSTPQGRFMTQILAACAEMERHTILENSYNGMFKKAQNGLWTGGSIYGYTANNGLKINPEQAEIVKEIFKSFANGKGLKSIALMLNNRGIKTIREKAWDISGIANILDNPTYIGKIRWTINRGKKDEQQLIIDGKHTPIISMELWNKVRERRQASTSPIKGRIYNGDFLIAGLLKCPRCGAPMHGMIAHGKNRYYRCTQNNRKGKIACTNQNNIGDNKSSTNIKADLIENDVMERINKYLKHPDTLKAIIRQINKEETKGFDDLLKNKQVLEKQLSVFKEERKEISQAKLDGNINMQELLRHQGEITKRENEVLAQIQNIDVELQRLSLKIESKKVVEIYKNKLEGLIDKDNEIKKIILSSIISEIRASEGENIGDRKLEDIVLYFQPEDILLASFLPTDVAYSFSTAHLILYLHIYLLHNYH